MDYSFLAEHANDVFFLYDVEGNRRYISPSSRRMLGYDPDEFASLPTYAAVHPDDVGVIKENFAKLSRGQPEFSSVHRLKRKDGQYIWVEALFRFIEASANDGEAIVSTVRDITERKQAEAEASRLQALLVDALEAMQDGVALYDLDDRLVLTNSSLKRLGRGYDDLFLPGRPYEDIVRAYWPKAIMDPNALEQFVTTALEGHRRSDGFPWEIKNVLGEWYLVRHFRSRDGGILTVSTDITALKEKETKLQSALRAAGAANVAKQDFLATMSHELRTPLNAIIGFSTILANQAFGAIENEKYLEFSKEIVRSGQHLLQLINSILEYSMLETEDFGIEETPVDIAAIGQAAIENMSPLASSAGVELRCVLPDGLPSINVEAKRVRQILDNLLSNAVKFTPAGGTVHLSASATQDGNLALAVKDTGTGISEENLPKVFEPFSQIDGTLSRKSQHGIGLGLSLAHRLVELSGGSLRLESALGSGTTASVVLPAPGTTSLRRNPQ